VKYKNFVAMIVCTALAACGGGGTSSSPSPQTTNNTTAATISAANVNDFINNVSMAIAFGITTRVGPNLHVVSNIPPVVTVQQNGCLLGTATFTLNRDGNNNVVGTGAYSDFENCAAWTIMGNVDVTGILVVDSIENFLLTFTDLTYTRTGTTESYHFSGTISLVWKPSVMGSAGYVMRGNGTVRDANNATVFALQDFQIDADMSAGQQSMLVSGRITNPVHGHVDLNTTSRFIFMLPGETIWSGSFAMTGANQTATVTYTNGTPLVSIQ
jgi:hypothetical protein